MKATFLETGSYHETGRSGFDKPAIAGSLVTVGLNCPAPDAKLAGEMLSSWPDAWSSARYGNRAFYYDAFVSHPSGDRSAPFVNDLTTRGLRIWHDESDAIEDARWTLRLVNAQRWSRWIVLFVGGGDVQWEQRKWVEKELRAAVEIETVTRVERLVVALAGTEDDVPPLAKHRRTFRVPGDLDKLREFLRHGNSLPHACSEMLPVPSIDSTLTAWLAPQDGAVSAITQSIVDLTRAALRETQKCQRTPSDSLYVLVQLLIAESIIPAEDQRAVSFAVMGIEALTAIGHTDSRANAFLILEKLAHWGSQDAPPALCRALAREEHPQVARQVAVRLLLGPSPVELSAAERMRLLLILADTDAPLWSKLRNGLQGDLSLIDLRRAARQMTAQSFRKHMTDVKRHEATARFKHIVDSFGSAAEWEVFFRELAGGHAKDSVPASVSESAAELDLFLEILGKFVTEAGSPLDADLWRVQWEVAILWPLVHALQVPELRERANCLRAAFIDLLRRPVARDLDCLEASSPSSSDDLARRVVEQLKGELRARLQVLEVFAEEPAVEEMGNGCRLIRRLEMPRELGEIRFKMGQLDLELAIREGEMFSTNMNLASIFHRWWGQGLV